MKVVKMLVLLSILGTSSDWGRSGGRASAHRLRSRILAQEGRSGLLDLMEQSELAQTSSSGEAQKVSDGAVNLMQAGEKSEAGGSAGLTETAMMELGRFFNSKDEPIVLSQAQNHARVVLTRRSRHKREGEEEDAHVFDLKEENNQFLQAD